MASFTLQIPDTAVPKIQAVVDTFNANNGLALTVRDWLILHIKEIAIQAELAESAEQIQKQAELDRDATMNAKFRAERQRLLDLLV